MRFVERVASSRRHSPFHCAAMSRPWCQSATLLTGPPLALADGERLPLGKHTVRWFDAPHVPHGWDCGFLSEERSATLLCGDLFTQGGADLPPVTESDILGPSEAFRAKMDYFSHTKNARVVLEKLASTNPTTLACMHGSAWRGDGRAYCWLLPTHLPSELPLKQPGPDVRSGT